MSKLALREIKEKVLADRVQYQAQIMRGDLLPRDTFKKMMGNIYATYSNMILSLHISAADTIGIMLHVPDADWNKIRTLMENCEYEMIKSIQEHMEMFISETL